jgi:hypothetical protein
LLEMEMTWSHRMNQKVKQPTFVSWPT